MIRKALAKDIPRIAEILVFGKRTAYRPIFQNDFVSFNELQVCSLAQEYNASPQILEDMLVYDDGIVKGVINAKFEKNLMEIQDFYVEPFFIGCGIGQALLQAALEKAWQCKADRIFLWVLAKNTKAQAFYEKNGFSAQGETQLVPGTTQWQICFQRILEQ